MSLEEGLREGEREVIGESESRDSSVESQSEDLQIRERVAEGGRVPGQRGLQKGAHIAGQREGPLHGGGVTQMGHYLEEVLPLHLVVHTGLQSRQNLGELEG